MKTHTRVTRVLLILSVVVLSILMHTIVASDIEDENDQTKDKADSKELEYEFEDSREFFSNSSEEILSSDENANSTETETADYLLDSFENG
jgi:hypothetical protein